MPAERSGPVAGVVLAAGASTRMGENKLFFELDGETLLRRVVGRAIAAGLDPVIVVLGYEAERARRELSGLACQPVINDDYAGGMHLSLRRGFAAVPDSAGAGVVVLADMPFVTSGMTETLVARYRESAAPLVISQYGEVNAPPMLYDRSLFPELHAVERGCSKQLIRRHRAEALVVSWPPSALTDVDVPADFERVKAQLATE